MGKLSKGLLGALLVLFSNYACAQVSTMKVNQKPFQVDGKGEVVTVFSIDMYDSSGQKMDDNIFNITEGDLFDVVVENDSTESVTIHWHGLLLPNDQDGVPDITEKAIAPGESKHFKYPIIQSGTYWMHSHVGMQEQLMLSAPYIIHKKDRPQEEMQEVVMFLQDFVYTNPYDLLEKLQHSSMDMGESKSMDDSDLNDVLYDAYLTNYRTLDNAQVVEVDPDTYVKLRIINASGATNFQMDTGDLVTNIVAIDGSDVNDYAVSSFPLAMANTLDVVVKIPKLGGFFPILAQAEGRDMQTGLVLATKGADIPKLNTKTSKPMGRIDINTFEKKLHTTNPRQLKSPTLFYEYILTGSMKGYQWLINDQQWPNITPKVVEKGDVVELSFVNNTHMSHPMHFHGHFFQLTQINDEKIFNGPFQNTVLVQPNSTVKVIFVADNPGIWSMHCHNIFHMNAGMFQTINYRSYPKPDFYIKKCASCN